MAQLVYRANVTGPTGKVTTHDVVVGGGTMTAEEVAAHLNETGHFDKHKPTKIVIDPEPIGQTEETVAQVIKRRGKMHVHRVAEVAGAPKADETETPDVDLSLPEERLAPVDAVADQEPEAPVAEVGTRTT